MKTTVKLEGRFETKFSNGKYGYENCITVCIWNEENERTIATDFIGSVTLGKYKKFAHINWSDNNGTLENIYKKVDYFKNRKRLSTIAKNILIKELKKIGRETVKETRY